ncbi:MAG: hypothetical protein LBR41_03485 [Rickettsiales bacterium]|jgi:hypothetical protein|nr:hypothetical protein [Rickettsiales bacterium]
MLKKITIFLFAFALCGAAHAATGFDSAIQLLGAARRGDTATVRVMVASGADVNFVDNTGMSIVCTALMNNDIRAAQILQSFGADASRCDAQIRNFNARAPATETGGMFSGLTQPQRLTVGIVAAAAAVGGVLLLTGAFGNGGGNRNDSGGSGGTRPGDGGGGGGVTTPNAWSPGETPKGPSGDDYNPDFFSTGTPYAEDFAYMSANGRQNNLLLMHGYSPLARGYFGQITFRAGKTPVPIENGTGGGKPITVAMITANGVDASGSVIHSDITYADSAAATSNTYTTDKFANWDTSTDTEVGADFYDLTGNGTVFNSGSTETDLAKIIAGREGDRSPGDIYGFIPNGQLMIFRTGTGDATHDWLNYRAMYAAAAMPAASRPDVIANLALNTDMRATNNTIRDLKALIGNVTDATERRAIFQAWIDAYYKNAAAAPGVLTPGQDAHNLFTRTSGLPMLIFSAGEYLVRDSAKAIESTFENWAPALYDGLNKNFMTVVAVSAIDGTAGVASAGGEYAGKIELSNWTDPGTSEALISRKCGDAGFGTAALDPWCFAAAGRTSSEAVASMSGAVGAIRGAFNYMTNAQVFTLLALTADGAWLGTDSDGNQLTPETLMNYLRTRFTLPSEYEESSLTDPEDYLDAFADVFGYGLINLERATRPGRNIYYYSGTADNPKIVATNPSYWRSATMAAGGAMGNSGTIIKLSAVDYVSDINGTVTMPRVFTNEINLGADARGLNMMTLAENISALNDVETAAGNTTIKMSLSSDAVTYTNTAGLKDLSFAHKIGDTIITAEFAARFGGEKTFVRGDGTNPVLGLMSNAVSTSVEYDGFGFSGFMGDVTDDELVANDPAVSDTRMPLQLGRIAAGEVFQKFGDEKFSLKMAVGAANESGTTLGTYSDGLLEMGGGDTVYANATAVYDFGDLRIFGIGTIARTRTNPGAGFINNMSELNSNAFSFGAEYKKFNLTAALPLAVTNGHFDYLDSNASVTDNDDGTFELVTSPEMRRVDLSPAAREFRIAATYSHDFSEQTDGTFGLIHRINPDHTDRFGNETILMMRMTHRIGI